MDCITCCVYSQIKQDKIKVIQPIEREREREVPRVCLDTTYFVETKNLLLKILYIKVKVS